MSYHHHASSRYSIKVTPNVMQQPTAISSATPNIDAPGLTSAKASKRNLLEGAVRFNEKPKDGLAFLESRGLIYDTENSSMPKHEALAKFLKSCPRLDKKLLGDFISRPDNVAVLRAFIELFDFTDVRFKQWRARNLAEGHSKLTESNLGRNARATRVFSIAWRGPTDRPNY